MCSLRCAGSSGPGETFPNKQPNQTHVPLQAPESPATWQREDVSPVPGWQRCQAPICSGSPSPDKHSRARPPTVGPAGPAVRKARVSGLRPPGPLPSPPWPHPPPRRSSVRENGRKDPGKENSRQDSAHLPRHFLKALPAGPRVTAPSHLPSPHSRPHQAICHPDTPLTQPSDSAPSPEAALWVAIPELGRGPELGVGQGGEDTCRPQVAFPRAGNPDCTASIQFLRQTHSPAEVLPKTS